MPSFVNTPKPVRKFAIVKRDTGEYLTVSERGLSIASAEFSAKGFILHAALYQYAHRLWINWLTANEFIHRRPTLAKEPVRYHILKEIPEVDIVAIDILPVLVYQLPTDPNAHQVEV